MAVIETSVWRREAQQGNENNNKTAKEKVKVIVIMQ